MTIQIDSREHQKERERIETQFDALGVKHFSSKLYIADYMNLDNPRHVVDRKKNLQELCGNVCQQHERFRNELVRAQEAGIHVTILCEHGGNIKTLEDVFFWDNPRLKTSPKALTGERLYRILWTISKKYDVDFQFCDKRSTGKRIVEILGDSEDNESRD